MDNYNSTYGKHRLCRVSFSGLHTFQCLTSIFIGASIILAGFITPVKAQIPQGEFSVYNGGMFTPEYLVQNVLVGQGIVVSNVTYTGDNMSTGYFLGESNLGLESGVVLSSGRATNIDAPASTQASSSTNGGSDNDLKIVSDRCNDGAGLGTFNATILEFDFVPQSTFVEFRYVFGSEEYPEYVGDKYNDSFGFFISGPGISSWGVYSNDARNIAIVPNTYGDLVCINSINQNTNSQYYIDNFGGATIAFDGFTKVLIARSPVVPCKTYHIKLAISDIGDQTYDSGVFLEANSFSSVGIQTNVSYTHMAVDTAVETCNSAFLEFGLSAKTMTNLTIHYQVEGSAENGIDYVAIADSIVVLGGDSIAHIDIVPIDDAIPEDIEVIEIIYNSSLCEYTPDTARIWIKDYHELFNNPSSNKTIYCQDTTLIYIGGEGGQEPYYYTWSTGDTTDVIRISPDTTTMYHYTLSDVCGSSLSDSLSVTVTGPTAVACDDLSICMNDPATLNVAGGTRWLWTASPPDPSLTSLIDTLQSPVVYPLSSTTYTVIAFDECGNSDTDAVTVLVDEPFADAGDDAIICTGDTYTLEANFTLNGVYVWTDAAGNVVGNAQQVDVTPAVTTTYTVSVTDNCGNTLLDNITVTVTEMTVMASADLTTVCVGTPVELTASSSLGGGTFIWKDDLMNVAGTDQTITVTPAVTTTYTVTVDDGCIKNGPPVTVTVIQLPLVTANAATSSICPDDSVIITAGGAVSYLWTSSPDDPSLAGQQTLSSPEVSPAESIAYKYKVIGTDANGCVNADSTYVNVKPRMYADFTVSDIAVCEGNELTLQYTGNGNSTATYDWDFDGGGSSTGNGQGPHQVSWSTMGTKTIKLTVTQLSCQSDEVTQTIDVNPTPHANFTNGIATGCVPLTVDFTDASTNTAPGVTYTWDFGAAGTSTGAVTSYEFAQPGTYNVNLMVANPGGCVDQKAVAALVEAWPLPVALFTADPLRTSLINPVVTFTSNSNESNLTYEWLTGDGAIYNIPVFTHTYADSGIFQVVMNVTNEYGCPGSTMHTIVITPRYILRIPTAFTPNSDGLNDKFKIQGNGVKEFSIVIYDRWGMKVFESKDINYSWDGTIYGQPAHPGVYVYHTYFCDENDEVSKQTGSILIAK